MYQYLKKKRTELKTYAGMNDFSRNAIFLICFIYFV